MKKYAYLVLLLALTLLGAYLVLIQPEIPRKNKTQVKVDVPIRGLAWLTGIKPNPWRLYWSEEFNATTIDQNYWTLQEGVNIWGNKELQHYTKRAENCYVKNGKLVIRGLKEEFQGSHFTSARITTKDKLGFLYGKLEIRAKLPEGQGLFPALWLMPCEDNYQSRRKNGELDIMEMLGHEPQIIYGVAHFAKQKNYKTSDTFYRPYVNFSRDFHRFVLEWSPDQLQWSVDDIPYYSLDLNQHFPGSYKPFAKRFYLIMNLAIGGEWPGVPTPATKFPAVMEIDYVRWYKR